MQNAKEFNTCMTTGYKLTTHGSEPVKDVQLYRSIVGALQYATIIGLKITYSVNKVCQFMQALLETHWQAVKRILRHLVGTLDASLVMKPNLSTPKALQRFCDANWASGIDDRRSTSEFCVLLGSNLIS